MTFKRTGRMTEPKPKHEMHHVCDQCGRVIGDNVHQSQPHFEVRWEPELSYNDEGSESWQADICSIACLQAYAAAGAPRVESDYS